jgi:Tfp pilus assembly protein PilX
MNFKFFPIKRNRKNKRHGEKGQALLIVLALFFLVSVMVMSSAIFIVTSLKTNNIYDLNTISTYSAEAGIQDAVTRIHNDSDTDLNTFFTKTATLPQSNDNKVTPAYIANTANPTYSYYDYTDRWAYVLHNSPVNNQSVNNQNINVYVQNVWVPTGITPPSIAMAQSIQQAQTVQVVTGNAGNFPTYDVQITYSGTSSITLTSIGVWLAQGFAYTTASSNLSTVLPTGTQYNEQVVPCAGNQAVIWSFPSGTTLTGGNSLSFNFAYTETSGAQQYPTCLTWVTVNPNASFPYPYTWDFSTKVDLITADAGNTEVQTYIPGAQTIQAAAISGDYYATGSSAMFPTDYSGTTCNDPGYRDMLLTSSSASTGTAIPTDAQVDGAYLYWSGWVQNYANGLFWDQCGVLSNTTINGVAVTSNWTTAGTWTVANNGQSNQQYDAYFQGTGSSSLSLTLANTLNLGGLTPYTSGSNQITSATISWIQWSSNGGTSSPKLYLGTSASNLAANNNPITMPALTSTPTLVKEQITSNGSLNQYLCSSFDMSIKYSGSYNICLDDILITDDGITSHYDPSVTFSVTNSSNQTQSETVPTGGLNPLVAWSAPVSSARGTSITFTNGSTTVTGSGFTTNPTTTTTGSVIQGNYIRSANDDPGNTSSWYKVASVDSSTSLTLSTAYTGTTNTSTYYVQDGYYYACKADVTGFVQANSNKVNSLLTGNGNGTYTVSNVFGNTESEQYCYPSMWPDLGDSAYAGWSLVIVYSDSSTLGHQLYLYDEFESVPNQGPGGTPYVINETLSGFIVPGELPNETSSSDVAKMTAFVGEGDVGLTNDYVAYVDSGGNLHYLWDGINCNDNTGSGYNTLTGNNGSAPYNVWNSSWIDQATMQPANVPGVDIDTFHIKWGENLITTNQTSATIQLSTNGDGYVLVYMIMSFRSSVTSGGPISYLITREPN